ncbi:hypothetical protein HYC85_017620 [Camellia sinensis]|uniref:Uncharacterized protein n=1 Tax=Camellia sinensis TaxID=4442 RepID=A0A7J7GRX8_CAMSI|nr:hypothetical protein HYC85_017620 [Camellia sinensis]
MLAQLTLQVAIEKTLAARAAQGTNPPSTTPTQGTQIHNYKANQDANDRRYRFRQRCTEENRITPSLDPNPIVVGDHSKEQILNLAKNYRDYRIRKAEPKKDRIIKPGRAAHLFPSMVVNRWLMQDLNPMKKMRVLEAQIRHVIQARKVVNVFIRKVKILKAPKFDLGKLMEVHGDYSTEDVGVKMERPAEEPVEAATEVEYSPNFLHSKRGMVKSNEEGLVPMKATEEKKRREQQRKAEESRGEIYLDAGGRTRGKSLPPLLQIVCEPNARARDCGGLCERV